MLFENRFFFFFFFFLWKKCFDLREKFLEKNPLFTKKHIQQIYFIKFVIIYSNGELLLCYRRVG